jgi:hypothetical protein
MDKEERKIFEVMGGSIIVMPAGQATINDEDTGAPKEIEWGEKVIVRYLAKEVKIPIEVARVLLDAVKTNKKIADAIGVKGGGLF